MAFKCLKCLDLKRANVIIGRNIQLKKVKRNTLFVSPSFLTIDSSGTKRVHNV